MSCLYSLTSSRTIYIIFTVKCCLMIRIGQRTRVREVTGREEARAVVRKRVREGGIEGWREWQGQGGRRAYSLPVKFLTKPNLLTSTWHNFVNTCANRLRIGVHLSINTFTSFDVKNIRTVVGVIQVTFLDEHCLKL